MGASPPFFPLVPAQPCVPGPGAWPSGGSRRWEAASNPPKWPQPSVTFELTQLLSGLSTLRKPGDPGLSHQDCRVVREYLLCPRNLFLFSFFSLLSFLSCFVLFCFVFPLSFCFVFLLCCWFFFFSSLSFPRLLCPMQHYFCDAWNTFDALIVVGSIVDIAITEVNVSTWRLDLTVRACSNTHRLSPVYCFSSYFLLPTSLFSFTGFHLFVYIDLKEFFSGCFILKMFLLFI